MEDSYQAKLWRHRYDSYSPRALVKVIAGHDPDVTLRVAAEVLDEKLAALGCEPVK